MTQIDLRPVSRFSAAALKLRRVFLETFPPEERPPYWFLLKRANSPVSDYCGIYADDRLVGLSYTLRNTEAAYLFFLALMPEARNCGYGAEAVRLLRARYEGRCFFLAHEQLDPAAENYAVRVRRHGFYLRCGLRDLPCTVTEGEVTYAVMGSGDAPSAAQYRALIDSYLGTVGKHRVPMYLSAKEDQL